MTYVCTLSGTLYVDGYSSLAVSLDFNGTWDAGGGPRFNIVDEDATMDAPIDKSTGLPQDEPMEMKYQKSRIIISGQFTDGWGTLDWITPVTKAEKLIALQKFAAIDTAATDCMKLTWPVAGKTLKCKFDRLDISEQAGGGNTLRYDISLQITG